VKIAHNKNGRRKERPAAPVGTDLRKKESTVSTTARARGKKSAPSILLDESKRGG